MICNRWINPPLVLLSFLVALPLVHFLAPDPTLIRTPWSLFGIVPVILGIALNIVADNLFTAHRTSIKPSSRPSCLVTSGPYAISRNPIYLGWLDLYLGFALLLNLSWALFLLPLVLLANHFVDISKEESFLSEKHGDKYQRYREKVRRYI